MKNLKLVIIGIVCSLFCSCVTSVRYYPNGLTTTDVKKKGDVYADIKISTISEASQVDDEDISNSVSGTIGVGITDHLFLYSKYSNARREFEYNQKFLFTNSVTEYAIKNNMEELEMGFGFNHHVSENSRFSFALIGQWGNSTEVIYNKRRGSRDRFISEYFSPAFQAGYTFDHKKFLFAWHTKLGHLSMKELNQVDSSVEFLRNNIPSTGYLVNDIKIGYGKRVRGFINFGLYSPFKGSILNSIASEYIGVGASINFGHSS